jgi:hypothetical protein
MRARRAHRPELAFLQHAQQLDLEGRAGVADLVEKDGAAVGLLEAAAAVFIGAGEGAALVAEKFGFEQLVGQRAAVLDDEGLVGAPAAVVDGARQHFLAGARFAADQHREVERGDLLDQRADGIERAVRRCGSAVETELAFDALAFRFDATRQHRLGGAQLERQALVLLLQAMDVLAAVCRSAATARDARASSGTGRCRPR